MQKEIRLKSLLQTQVENEVSLGSILLILFASLFLIGLVTVGFLLFQDQLSWQLITLGFINLGTLVYFYFRVTSIHKNLQKIKQQIRKLKTSKT